MEWVDPKFKLPKVQRGLVYAFDTFPDGIALFDENNTYLIHNKKFTQIYTCLQKILDQSANPCSFDDITKIITQSKIAKITTPNDTNYFPNLIFNSISTFSDTTLIASWQEKHPSNTIIQVYLYGLPDGGKIYHAKDITANIAHIQHFKELALTDSLTQIANRGCFSFKLTELLQPSQDQKHICIVLIDLNDFKNINDAHGHDGGDNILKQVAKRLKKHIRGTQDLLARLGGDEFAIILNDIQDKPAVLKIVNRFKKDLEDKPYLLPSGQTVNVSMSIGISLCHQQNPMCEKKLLIFADQAMYNAKRHYKKHAKNKIYFYESNDDMDCNIGKNSTPNGDKSFISIGWFKNWQRKKAV